MRSTNRPSRALRESVATIVKNGRFLAPPRASRIKQDPPRAGVKTAQTDPPGPPPTGARTKTARSTIPTNRSPTLPFDQSINPYRGCEHGCVYCYARPSHTYLGLSAGLDFETKIFAKTNAAELLRKELSRTDAPRSMIALGANTDPYQPTALQVQITRSML